MAVEKLVQGFVVVLPAEVEEIETNFFTAGRGQPQRFHFYFQAFGALFRGYHGRFRPMQQAAAQGGFAAAAVADEQGFGFQTFDKTFAGACFQEGQHLRLAAGPRFRADFLQGVAFQFQVFQTGQTAGGEFKLLELAVSQVQDAQLPQGRSGRKHKGCKPPVVAQVEDAQVLQRAGDAADALPLGIGQAGFDQVETDEALLLVQGILGGIFLMRAYAWQLVGGVLVGGGQG